MILNFWVVVLIFLDFLAFGDKCAVFVFHLSLSSISLGDFAESCFFPFRRHKTKKPTHNNNSKESGDRGCGIGDFQHCIVITPAGRKDTQNGKRCGKK